MTCAAAGGGGAGATSMIAAGDGTTCAALLRSRDDFRPIAKASTTAIAATANHSRLMPDDRSSGGDAARSSRGAAGRALATMTPQRGQAGVVTPDAPHRGQSIATMVPRPARATD